jgi:hypothetical protein
MDNVQKHNVCINVPSSQTFRSYKQNKFSSFCIYLRRRNLCMDILYEVHYLSNSSSGLSAIIKYAYLLLAAQITPYIGRCLQWMNFVLSF